MVTWRLSCSGLFDVASMTATVLELGGYQEMGCWYIRSDRHPVHLCRRLASNFISGPFNVRLDVVQP